MRSLVLLVCLLAASGWQANAARQAPFSVAPQEEYGASVTIRGSQVPRVNAPYDVPGEESAILWFGRVTTTENSVDARVAYQPEYLYVRVAVFDRRLWYTRSPTASELADWDAVTLYLGTMGNVGSQPGMDAYRFEAQLSSLESREEYQAAYQGDGTDWIAADRPFTTTAAWRGNGPNDDVDDRGWALTFRIPYETVSLDGPPPPDTIWGIALSAHDRDDALGTDLADQRWPLNMVPDEPASWAQLAFGLPDYSPPLAVPAGTAIIRQGLDGAIVPDADVGGSSTCGAEAAPDYFPTWGELNYAAKTSSNIQNLGDVGDWPCFSRYYVTFPLDAVPVNRPILSATLTLHLWGGAGQGYNPGPQPSFIQVLTVDEPWLEDTITWNNAPLARENLGATWVYPVGESPDPPGIPYQWDVTRAVAEARAAGAPLRLALYEADWAYHSGKYFYASDTGDWNAEGRPTLTVTWGQIGGYRHFLPLVVKGTASSVLSWPGPTTNCEENNGQ